jgi:hypothetical protein
VAGRIWRRPAAKAAVIIRVIFACGSLLVRLDGPPTGVISAYGKRLRVIAS